MLTSSSFARYVVVQALDANGKRIGKSKPVQTIQAVEDDWEFHPSESTHEFVDKVTADDATENEDISKPKETSHSGGDSDSWSTIATSFFTNQIVALVIGFVACGVICAVTFLAIRTFRGRSWRRTEDTRYEPLAKNHHEELEDEEEKVPEAG